MTKPAPKCYGKLGEPRFEITPVRGTAMLQGSQETGDGVRDFKLKLYGGDVLRVPGDGVAKGVTGWKERKSVKRVPALRFGKISDGDALRMVPNPLLFNLEFGRLT